MKLYDIKQANKALFLVQPIVEDIIGQNNTLTIMQNIMMSSGHLLTSEALKTLQRDIRIGNDFLNHHLNELTYLGINLTNIENGTVDFPTSLQPHETFLCWTLGQEEVTFFHGQNCSAESRKNLYTLT